MTFGKFCKFYHCTEEEIKELQLYYLFMLLKKLAKE